MQKRRVALIGNPNTGKSTLFNALTGLSQRTGNYPGVTVERKAGRLSADCDVLDLPGTYSLAGRSPDELIANEVLLGLLPDEARPDLVVVVTNASQLERGAYLVTQVLELGLPVLVVANMIDLAEAEGVVLDAESLSRSLGCPVILSASTRGESVEAVRQGILAKLGSDASSAVVSWPEALETEVQALCAQASLSSALLRRAIFDDGLLTEEILNQLGHERLHVALIEARKRLVENGIDLARIETQVRYDWIESHLRPHIQVREASEAVFSDRLDAILLHKVLGSLIFAFVMSFVFIAIFSWAGPVMDAIEGVFEGLGGLASGALKGLGMDGGPLESLIVEGAIGGVGGVLVFLPQILLLFFFLALLEDCGYMARAAFLMDRVLRFAGLSGHSFVPLMSSFACAVPGIMATRTIGNRADRLVTMLVAPLMSCSARIPVYTLMIAAFVPASSIWGLPLQGLVFAGMYLLGILIAIPFALALKVFLGAQDRGSFLMELPSYKWPTGRAVFMRVWQAGAAFIVRAGTLILLASIVIWALGYYPRSSEVLDAHEALRVQARAELSDQPDAVEPKPAEGAEPGDEAEEEEPSSPLSRRIEEIDALEIAALKRQSYLGRMGVAIEPVVSLAGWNWQIGVAVLASFPAREVIVSTLGILYELGEEVDEESKSLPQKLKEARWPDGRPVYNLPVALSILVFFALCMQCAATLATIKQESGSWGWAAFSFVALTSLAFLGAVGAYQGAMALGWGAL